MNRRRFVTAGATLMATIAIPLGVQQARAASTVGATIADIANQQLGKPYVWGTRGPDTFDCSGLVQYCVWQATGDTISASSYDQIGLGVPVQAFDLQRGDILCFDSEGNGSCGHVGVYDGPGRMISALNEDYGVVVSDPFSAYFAPIFLGARRLYGGTDAQGDQGDQDNQGNQEQGSTPVDGVPSGTTLTVTDGPLNVRSGPSRGHGVVTVVMTGTVLTVTGGSQASGDYTWAPITTTSGDEGWVATEFCTAGSVPTEGGDASAPVAGWGYQVATDALNLRSAAGLDQTVLAVMPYGERLNVNDGPVSVGDYQWYRVTTRRYGAGWCADMFEPL